MKGIFNFDDQTYLYSMYAMTSPPSTEGNDHFSYIFFDGFRRLMNAYPSEGGVLHCETYSYELIPMTVSYYLHNILIDLN